MVGRYVDHAKTNEATQEIGSIPVMVAKTSYVLTGNWYADY